MINVGVVGATGYTGLELLRLLAKHPSVAIRVITSRTEAGRKAASLFGNLRGHLDLEFVAPELERLAGCDLTFFATPNGTAMTMAPDLLEQGIKVIDLSADFRLKDPAVWREWYGLEHACPAYLAEAVYGLPEMNRERIAKARLAANPGCYPTAVQLGFLPLLKHSLIDVKRLIADVKSGLSGAGRKAAFNLLLCEAGENVTAYAIEGHRHLPEITQGLNQASPKPVSLTFLPHLVPMIRGIQASLYGTLLTEEVDLQSLFEDFYQGEPFVEVLPAGSSPATRDARGTNMLQLGICRPQGGRTVVVLAAEDNLVKGAAGQAVQNMNIMFGLDETLGLDGIAALP